MPTPTSAFGTDTSWTDPTGPQALPSSAHATVSPRSGRSEPAGTFTTRSSSRTIFLGSTPLHSGTLWVTPAASRLTTTRPVQSISTIPSTSMSPESARCLSRWAILTSNGRGPSTTTSESRRPSWTTGSTCRSTSTRTRPTLCLCL